MGERGGVEVKAMDDERRRVLVELLDHWRDFFDEQADSGTAPVEEGRELSMDWSLFSSMGRWPSVVELRRCVEMCARMGPSHYRHLVAATAKVEWRLVDKPVKRRNAHGKLVDDVERVRERVVPRWVSSRMVDRALDFVLGVWDQAVPLELPPPLVLKLRPLADADGWTEAA
jgi:hypothetical protein